MFNQLTTYSTYTLYITPVNLKCKWITQNNEHQLKITRLGDF